jgi:hypothetical protein
VNKREGERKEEETEMKEKVKSTKDISNFREERKTKKETDGMRERKRKSDENKANENNDK